MNNATATVLVFGFIVMGAVALGLGLGIVYLLRGHIIASAAPNTTTRIVTHHHVDDTAHERINGLEQRMVAMGTLPGRVTDLENRAHYLRLDLDALIARFDRLGHNVRQSFSAVAAIVGAVIGILLMLIVHAIVSNGTISARDFQSTQ